MCYCQEYLTHPVLFFAPSHQYNIIRAIGIAKLICLCIYLRLKSLSRLDNKQQYLVVELERKVVLFSTRLRSLTHERSEQGIRSRFLE
jgi:hypothetical protein